MGSLPSPGDLPNPVIEPRSPTLQADSSLCEPQGKPKNTGVSRLSLLQRIFPSQESNQGLLHCRRILYQLSYKGSPSTCQCKRHGFSPWSRKIPGAVEQLSPCDLEPWSCNYLNPCTLEPVLHKRSHPSEKAHALQLEKSPSRNEDPAQTKINRNLKIKMKQG